MREDEEVKEPSMAAASDLLTYTFKTTNESANLLQPPAAERGA